jgi:hypothetical protein
MPSESTPPDWPVPSDGEAPARTSPDDDMIADIFRQMVRDQIARGYAEALERSARDDDIDRTWRGACPDTVH